MMSLTSKYALRASVYLAQHEKEWPIPGNIIAKHTGIPSKYLSKILGDLARAGILHSSRGRTGGFRMAIPATKVFLYDILLPFESELSRQLMCPFGNMTCTDDDPCLGHDPWKKVFQTYITFLRRTSVQRVAFGKRKR